MNFGIYFAHEGYTTNKPELMGRHAAGASFIRGLLTHTKGDTVAIVPESGADITEFESLIKKYRPGIEPKVIPRISLKNLGSVGGLFYPGPDIGRAALERSIADEDGASWALCGITHTTSSSQAMDSITSWITTPVQQWDAVICTSTTVKQNVETILQAQVDSLKLRLGITKITIPQLPVIPIGIHTADFNYTKKERVDAKRRVGAAGEEIVFLYTGRLSFHAKAHPLAMYQALEAASVETGKPLILVECGWHANDYIRDSFKDAAARACPSVRVINLDGRKETDRTTAWASADIFCSLSDNIQETFGIVPLEAMAAGIPVVVSDWDGYRDTVRHGVDGFRVPTMTPPPGLAGDLAYRHALNIDSYDMYCGHSSSMVTMHHGKLKQAFINLIQSPELRKSMGEMGLERARNEYDWSTVFAQYESLWSEQTKMRLFAKDSAEKNKKSRQKDSFWPARLDPTIGFAGYPTMHISEDTLLEFNARSSVEALEKLHKIKQLNMVSYTDIMSPKIEEIESIFKSAEENLPNPTRVAQLTDKIENMRKPLVTRGLVWLCKLGFFDFT